MWGLIHSKHLLDLVPARTKQLIKIHEQCDVCDTAVAGPFLSLPFSSLWSGTACTCWFCLECWCRARWFPWQPAIIPVIKRQWQDLFLLKRKIHSTTMDALNGGYCAIPLSRSQTASPALPHNRQKGFNSVLPGYQDERVQTHFGSALFEQLRRPQNVPYADYQAAVATG